MASAGGTLRLFVDEAVIHVRGGKGGNGCVSFRREKYIPKGGPDGGDGGQGGSVFLVAKAGIDTLLDLAGRHHYHAEAGRPGSGNNRTGRSGRDLIVTVPTGTLVYDQETGRLLKDLAEDDARVCVARGGRGGRGNTRFATSTHQTPREFEEGTQGRERLLRLELRLIADVGLVGLPNAGKSTLLSRLTKARPKIADYPFTTREPQLGILELPGFRRLVVADLPGLIEGAHTGAGLGDAFLRHVERTRVIAHLVDLAPPEGAAPPVEAYRIIRSELEQYSAALAAREEIVVGTKLDLTGADTALQQLQSTLHKPILAISGVTGAGLRELAEALWTVVARAREEQAAARPALLDLGPAGREDSAAAPAGDALLDEGDAPRPDFIPPALEEPDDSEAAP